jgi:hypothetical protein
MYVHILLYYGLRLRNRPDRQSPNPDDFTIDIPTHNTFITSVLTFVTLATPLISCPSRRLSTHLSEITGKTYFWNAEDSAGFTAYHALRTDSLVGPAGYDISLKQGDDCAPRNTIPGIASVAPVIEGYSALAAVAGDEYYTGVCVPAEMLLGCIG